MDRNEFLRTPVSQPEVDFFAFKKIFNDISRLSVPSNCVSATPLMVKWHNCGILPLAKWSFLLPESQFHPRFLFHFSYKVTVRAKNIMAAPYNITSSMANGRFQVSMSFA